MEEREVSAMLDQLKPTLYGEFLAKWPEIKKALGRGVSLTAIHNSLTQAGSLTTSYVTFTKYVRKATREQNEDTVVAANESLEPRSVREYPAAQAVDSPGIRKESATEPHEEQDKSETIATSAADALKDAKATSSSKNYAKNLRRRST